MTTNKAQPRLLRAAPSRLAYPIQAFIQAEASGGILLIAAALAALIWANSPWAASYAAFWETELAVRVGDLELRETLQHWVADGLMAIFFFVIGLEIKREVLVGELAAPRQAILPIVAAIGGAIVPALLYTTLNQGTAGADGWGIPMATDIAFAVGVLALLGSRAPGPLKVFLTALAIVDDLIAVLVIAIFYTDAISIFALLVAAALLVALALLNLLGIYTPVPYAILGIGLWLAMLESGVHATVAGVLLALTIPARTRIAPAAFYDRALALLHDYQRASTISDDIRRNPAQQAAVEELEEATVHVLSPLQRLEHSLHPWVAFGIMPLFALANAGVSFSSEAIAAAGSPITLGTIVGLAIGKPAGVIGSTWIATRSGLAQLPEDITWRHVIGAGWLAGIGFTMSLFVAGLAFDDDASIQAAKFGILAGSLFAGVVGWLLLSVRAGDD